MFDPAVIASSFTVYGIVMPRRRGVPCGIGAPADRRTFCTDAQHVGQQRASASGGHGRRRLNLRQCPIDQLPSLLAAEHLLADRFHDVLGHDAADHRQFGAAATDRTAASSSGFSPSPKNACPAASPKPCRDDHGDRGLAALHRLARRVGGRLRHLEFLSACGPGHDRLRDRAAVLIDDRDGNPRRLAVASGAGKDRRRKTTRSRSARRS